MYIKVKVIDPTLWTYLRPYNHIVTLDRQNLIHVVGFWMVYNTVNDTRTVARTVHTVNL